MSVKEEVFSLLGDAVIEGDDALAVSAAKRVIQEGLDPTEAIMEGLAGGMAVVGEYYENQQYFLTEVIISAEAFNAGVEILLPHLQTDIAPPGVVVIGTVQGDTHDIGKNIVGIMLNAAGFVVHDVGRDVSPETFVAKVKETNADILGLSALMTSSMVNMKKVVERLKQEGVRENVKVIIGGAPVSTRYAKEIGADGYSPDAVDAVRLAKSLLAVQ
jgi:corrinoid protein of di/trimethylamine methyltransferase